MAIKGKISINELNQELQELVLQGGGSICFKKNNTTITETTNIVNIGIPEFDKTTDMLFVFVNTTYIELGIDYEISNDNLYITKKENSWNISGKGMIFNFIVLKNVPELVDFDGRLIQNNSISYDKIDEAFQQTIENAANKNSGNDIYARNEIIDLKLKLKEQLGMNFINNNSGIGFFDTFETDESINKTTTASYDKINKSIDFNNNMIIHSLASSKSNILKIKEKYTVKPNDIINNIKVLSVEEVLKGEAGIVEKMNADLLGTKFRSKNGSQMIKYKNDLYLLSRIIPVESDTLSIICYKSTDRGVTWKNLNFPINNDSSILYNSSNIAIDSSNNVHLVYYNRNSAGDGKIMYSKYTLSTNSWSEPIQLQSSLTGSQTEASIAIDSKNNIHVVWEGVDSSSSTVHLIKYTKFSNGSWSNYINLINTTHHQYSPQIAIDSKDNIHVVWYGADVGKEISIKGIKFNGTSWSTVQDICSDNEHHSAVKIVIDTEDNVHAVWYSTTSYKIRYSMYNGSSWSKWVNVYDIGEEQSSPEILIDSDKNLYFRYSAKISSSKYIPKIIKVKNSVVEELDYDLSGSSFYYIYNNILYIASFDMQTGCFTLYNRQNGFLPEYDKVTLESPLTISIGKELNLLKQDNLKLVMNDEVFEDKFKKIKLNLYPKNINFLEVYENADNSNILLSRNNINGISLGDRLFINNKINRISAIDKNNVNTIINTQNIIDIEKISDNVQIISNSNNDIYCVFRHDKGLKCFMTKDNCKTWTDLEFPSFDVYQFKASIDLDSNDNLHVVWHGYTGSNNRLRVKYIKYMNGVWSNIKELTRSDDMCSDASIAIDSKDNIHVVWYGADSSNTYHQIQYSKFNGTSWSSPINIQTINNYQQVSPIIKIDSKDNLHVVWSGTDPSSTSDRQIKYSKFDGSSWSNWINIQNITGQFQLTPSIDIDNSDNLHVVWNGTDSSNPSIRQIKYSKFDGSSWSNWINITSQSNSCYNPSIKVNNDGEIHVFYNNIGTPGIHKVDYLKYNKTNWTTPVTISNTSMSSQYAVIDRNMKNFKIPLIAYLSWTDQHNISIYGDYYKEMNTKFILEEPITVQQGQNIPLINLEAEHNSVPMKLDSVSKTECVYSIDGLDTNCVKLNVLGANEILEGLSYSIS